MDLIRAHLDRLRPGFAFASLCVLLATLVAVVAQSDQQIEAAREILAEMAPSEVPAKAAQLLVSAPVVERSAVAAAVGKAVALTHPKMAPAAVAAISHRMAPFAAAAAASAASVLPQAAATIAAGAVSGKEVRSKDVETAMIAAVPDRAEEITQAIAARRTVRVPPANP